MNRLRKISRLAYSIWQKRMIHLNLQILYSCNFKCKICSFWHEEKYLKMPAMTVENARAIARSIRPLGAQIVSIGGGEPFLHPHLEDIISAFAVDHFPVMICNGWCVDEHRARSVFKSGVCEVSVSVDYATAEKHDRQRGCKGAWEKAITALETLHRCRTRADQRVHMISVIMDDNLDEIEPLIRCCENMGITFLVTLYSTGRGEKPERNTPLDVSKKLRFLHNKYRNFVALPAYLDRFSEASSQGHGILPCYSGINLFNIDPAGQVSRCIDCLDEPAGNILSDDLGEILIKLRQQSQNGTCCSCWTSCRGNIESFLYGSKTIKNLVEMWPIVRPIELGKSY